ncbi:MAG TPA: YihY/virulence factor BrkB family protein [Acidobacteriota bacterium]
MRWTALARLARSRRVANRRSVWSRLGRFARLIGQSAWRGLRSFARSEDLTFASSIAYYALLSLFPFFLLAFSILKHVTADEADRTQVLQYVLWYFPRQFEFIKTQLDALRGSPAPLGLVGSLLMAWASLGVFGAITSAINHAWGVEQPHGFFKHKWVSFVMLVAAGLLLLAVLLSLSAMGVVRRSWFGAVLADSWALRLLSGLTAWYATTLLFILVVGLIYYFVPNTRVRFRDVWPGAVLTGLLWRATLQIFSGYVQDLSRFSVHGSIAAVVVFLIWVFVSSILLLYGAEFTAAYAHLRQPHRIKSSKGRPE